VSHLAWNWLCLPYLACALAMVAVGLVAALVRGDRVLRLGSIGAATTALPWALCSAISTWTTDPDVATRLLRLGNGPVALVGPSLLLVLLGVSGQLERHRWIARLSGAMGVVLFVLCWATDWTVPGVHRLSSGIYYPSPGPLTGFHFAQIGIWLAAGLVIARRSMLGGERRRLVQMLIAVLALGTIGSSDLLLVYEITGTFPIAWLPTGIAAGLAVYYEIKTDLLRPQGFDRGVFVELVAFAVTTVCIAVVTLLFGGAAPVAIAAIGSVVWATALGFSWARAKDRPVQIAHERALEQFIANLGDGDSDAKIAERLAALWKQVAIEMRAVRRVETDPVDPEVAAWFVTHGDALAASDLNTMLLGAIRPRLEALVGSGATLIVPLIDRGTLVGLVEADHGAALREEERGLVVESARAAARALTYVGLAKHAALERETAREVEVAEAMRLQASASRDDELGRWAVGAEYHSSARTTGAGWSASLLADGRLAVLVTEAQAHGVAAALATAALTGAFAAATTTSKRIGLDDLLASLRASAEGVVRGGEPVAAFVAILDADTHSVTWACAGHPGATLLGAMPDITIDSAARPRPPITTLGGGGARLGATLNVATRGTTQLPPTALLVVASTTLRGTDDAIWHAKLAERAPGGPRLAAMLVESALAAGAPREDFLAVVVRQRLDRRSEPVIG
jgi:GAF domain-containing protein